LPRGTGLVGTVIDSDESVIVNDVSQDARFSSSVDRDTGFRTRSVLCVPLRTNRRMWGAIEVLNRSSGEPFGDDDRRFCEAIASLAAIAIENAVLHERIVAAERLAAVGQTIAGMAHCIKNVLSGIRGGAYMVDKGLKQGEAEPLVTGWEIVRKNNGFLENLVLDMLQYSKDREPEFIETDPVEFLEDIRELVAGTAEEKHVAVGVSVSADAPASARFDPNGMRRALLNLVGNAIDACAGGLDDRQGCVELCAVAGPDGGLDIVVRDNGCGIEPEARERLFEVFFSTKGNRGTGLGLAVTHKIVSEHGGSIAVDSTPGTGTTFTVHLPARESADARQEE
jgi:signal transduction histidine kinase